MAMMPIGMQKTPAERHGLGEKEILSRHETDLTQNLSATCFILALVESSW